MKNTKIKILIWFAILFVNLWITFWHNIWELVKFDINQNNIDNNFYSFSNNTQELLKVKAIAVWTEDWFDWVNVFINEEQKNNNLISLNNSELYDLNPWETVTCSAYSDGSVIKTGWYVSCTTGKPYNVSFVTNWWTEVPEQSVLWTIWNIDSIKDWYIAEWYTDENLTNKWNLDTDIVSGDMTLYAIRNAIVNITFETNWWDTIDDITFIKWSKISEIIPYKEYSSFKWWYTDEDLTIPMDFNNTIEIETTLYAKWEESCFSFDPNIKTITWYNVSWDWCWTGVTIPAQIWGVDVENIWLYSFSNKNLESVIFNNKIKSIWKSAFYWNNLTEVTLPESIEYIRSYAFDDWTIIKWWDKLKLLKNWYKFSNNDNIYSNVYILNNNILDPIIDKYYIYDWFWLLSVIEPNINTNYIWFNYDSKIDLISKSQDNWLNITNLWEDFNFDNINIRKFDNDKLIIGNSPELNNEKIKLEIKENDLSWEEVSSWFYNTDWYFEGYLYSLQNKLKWKNEIIFKITYIWDDISFSKIQTILYYNPDNIDNLIKKELPIYSNYNDPNSNSEEVYDFYNQLDVYELIKDSEEKNTKNILVDLGEKETYIIDSLFCNWDDGCTDPETIYKKIWIFIKINNIDEFEWLKINWINYNDLWSDNWMEIYNLDDINNNLISLFNITFWYSNNLTEKLDYTINIKTVNITY